VTESSRHGRRHSSQPIDRQAMKNLTMLVWGLESRLYGLEGTFATHLHQQRSQAERAQKASQNRNERSQASSSPSSSTAVAEEKKKKKETAAKKDGIKSKLDRGCCRAEYSVSATFLGVTIDGVVYAIDGASPQGFVVQTVQMNMGAAGRAPVPNGTIKSPFAMYFCTKGWCCRAC